MQMAEILPILLLSVWLLEAVRLNWLHLGSPTALFIQRQEKANSSFVDCHLG